MRLCPGASGAVASKMRASRPGMLRVRAREILGALSYPAHVGQPPSVNTYAQLEYAAIVYQSAELASKSFGAQHSLLVSLE